MGSQQVGTGGLCRRLLPLDFEHVRSLAGVPAVLVSHRYVERCKAFNRAPGSKGLSADVGLHGGQDGREGCWRGDVTQMVDHDQLGARDLVGESVGVSWREGGILRPVDDQGGYLDFR